MMTASQDALLEYQHFTVQTFAFLELAEEFLQPVPITVRWAFVRCVTGKRWYRAAIALLPTIGTQHK